MSLDSAPTQLGNYDIERKIAEGGMGTVYKARHRFTGDVVAVKVIGQVTAKNPVLLQRFEREFMAARVLDHPNVVRAIEYCGTGPHPFLVMEFVDGDSIGQLMERKGAFEEEEAVRLIAQVCEGLQRAHKQGLVHRDVKPDNILVTHDGLAKLTDMGLVRDMEGDLNLTKTGRGLGTPHYMAPEQFRNAKGVDIRGDIYSLGATLYAMVTGQVPFENASPLDCWMKKIRNEFAPPKELNPALSDRVDWAIRRSMSAEPDRRPASCREFVEDLTGQSRTTPVRTGTKWPATAAKEDIWYIVYKDEVGTTHTVKGSTEGIRQAIRDQLLGDASSILVSRSKTGQFAPLVSIPEFRDLVVLPAPSSGTALGRSTGDSSGRLSLPRPGPASGRHRRPNDDAVDLGAPPPPPDSAGSLGSRANRSTSPSSGRGLPPPRQTPTRGQTPTRPTSSRRPTVTPPVRPQDPRAETTNYRSGPTPTTTPTPSRQSTPPAQHSPPPSDSRKKASFDWTPILMLVVTVLSAVIGYVFLTRYR